MDGIEKGVWLQWLVIGDGFPVFAVERRYIELFLNSELSGGAANYSSFEGLLALSCFF